MREIIFKGKIKNSSEKDEELNWVYGNLVKELSTGRTYIVDLSKFSVETKFIDIAIEVDPETVCQYTGLKDRNGKKIFEGDIVRAKVIERGLSGVKKYTSVYEVAYHPKYCYFYLKKERNNLLFDGNWSYGVFIEDVIGTIFDNPELL